MTKQSSIDAYNEIKANGLLKETFWIVYDAVYRWGPISAGGAHMLVEREGIHKIPHSLGPRFAPLGRMGVIRMIGRRPCIKTGFSVQHWEVTGELPNRDPGPEESFKKLHKRIDELEEEVSNLLAENNELRRRLGMRERQLSLDL